MCQKKEKSVLDRTVNRTFFLNFQLQSSVSVEDSVSGNKTITMITGIDNRQLSQPENSVVRASTNTGSVAATKSADKSEPRIQPSVLGCHPVTSNLSSSPSTISTTTSGPRRCIVLQHNNLTGGLIVLSKDAT